MSISKSKGESKSLPFCGSRFDTLTEFHLRNPDCHTYELIDQLISILRQSKQHDRIYLVQQLKEKFGDKECIRILKLIAVKTNLDYNELINIKTHDGHFIPPKLLLHLLCLSHSHYKTSIDFLAGQLELDPSELRYILQQLRSNFTIDDPLSWLEGFIQQFKKERQYCEKCRDDLKLGRNIVGQEQDTAEKRRVNVRNRLHSIFRKLFRPS